MTSRNSSRACLIYVATLFCLLGAPGRATAAETLPGPVADIMRDLSEMREVTQGYVQAANQVYSTNQTDLRQLNSRYIEVSAVGNSLIDQFRLETTARTPMQVKRYTKALTKAQDKFKALGDEYERLMAAADKTRGATRGGGNPEIEKVSKVVDLADNVLKKVIDNRAAFRNLDTTQRDQVKTLLVELKWKPLSALR